MHNDKQGRDNTGLTHDYEGLHGHVYDELKDYECIGKIGPNFDAYETPRNWKLRVEFANYFTCVNNADAKWETFCSNYNGVLSKVISVCIVNNMGQKKIERNSRWYS